MSEDEIREALREYRRWLLEQMGDELTDVLSERWGVEGTYLEEHAERLCEINTLLKRDDLIRAAAERLKVKHEH